MAIIEIFRDEFTTITIDPMRPLVRSVRSDIPFPSLEVLEIAVANQIRTYDELGRGNRVLCIDLRAVMGRNDVEFEERMAKLRLRLYGGFLRIGVLVRSSVGALQIKRLLQEDKLARMVTTDESALLDYLLNG